MNHALDPYNREQFWAWQEDPANKANKATMVKVQQILARAFPKHDDRSDIMTDYHDRCWSFRN